MEKLRNLRNKPTPKKKGKIYIKTGRKPNAPRTRNTEQAPRKEPETKDQRNDNTGNKRKMIQIVKKTQNFDPSDFLQKINPSMLVFLNKQNLEPIVQEDVSNKKTPEPNVTGDAIIPTTIDKATSDEPVPVVEKVAEEKKQPTARKPKTMRDKTRKIVSRRPNPEINLDDYNIESVDDFIIEGRKIKDRLPIKKQKIILKASSYHLNNSKKFVNFIEKLFNKYKLEAQKTDDNQSCQKLNEKKRSGKFTLLLHQKLVRDYLNTYTPYRGLFLYFGLGAGKTCSSIAIAEGLKDYHKIVVMTPASLKQNYINELKFCGDDMYKKNQFWQFITTTRESQEEAILSTVLNLPLKFIRRNNGAWLVDTKRESNYNQLSEQEKITLEKQINKMIFNKYQFINYNGLREDAMQLIESQGEGNGGNFFNNKVIIIDEVHNLISRIVNKMGKNDSISIRLYKLLMDAENCKIVFLSGTPIINYPNEIAIFYNILRGYIKTYSFNLNTSKLKGKIVNKDYIKKILKNNDIDYIEFKPQLNNLLTVTQNPFNFVNRYNTNGNLNGVQKKRNSDFSSSNNFIKKIILVLKSKGIMVEGKPRLTKHKCLPDDIEVFTNTFIDSTTNEIKNSIQFQKRILGLTSHFKSADEKLLPKFNPDEDIILERVVMSDYQLGIYEAARIVERKEETRNARKRKGNQVSNVYQETTSTYRIFSRAFCNFVFPDTIRRPMPREQNLVATVAEEKKENTNLTSPVTDEIKEQLAQKNDLNEHNLDNVNAEEPDTDSSKIKVDDNKYEIRIMKALKELSDNSEALLTGENLQTYSPKFYRILENISKSEHFGTHLIYSNFRTLEGIGIFKIVLEANGFVEFKIEKVDGVYRITTPIEELRQKPAFALYTGTESTEIKEYTRLCFNSEWDPSKLPESILSTLQSIHPNNYFGEVIKCFMITSSGAEGINLKNTRFVHLVEPYWHPVREEQVIGRAVRICSHEALPDENDNRSVKVFKYLTVFSEEQLYGKPDSERKEERKPKVSTELKLKDVSKYYKDNKGQPLILTSDQALNEISMMKKQINQNILNAIRSSSIDCKIYNKKGTQEYSQCFVLDDTGEGYLYNPSLTNDETDAERKINIQKKRVKAKIINLRSKDGTKYKAIWIPLTKTNPVGNIYKYQEWIDNNKKIRGIDPVGTNIHVSKLK